MVVPPTVRTRGYKIAFLKKLVVRICCISQLAAQLPARKVDQKMGVGWTWNSDSGTWSIFS